jgi:thiol-disulfide isomerase/thioredoxin
MPEAAFRRPARGVLRSLAVLAAVMATGLLPVVTESLVPDARADEVNQRAWLGVQLKSGPNKGVLASRVIRNSPAALGGVKPGDVILAADGMELDKASQLIARVALVGPGNTMKLRVRRDGSDRDVAVTLAPHPGADAILRMDKIGTFASSWGAEVAGVTGSLPSNLGKLRGKVVLLDFWASWCAPCRLIVPQLAELSDQYAAQGLSVVGITGDPVKVASEAAQRLEINYTTASDQQETLAADYGVRALPTMFLIDKRGVIREVYVGFHPAHRMELEKRIQELLAEPAPSP